MGCHAEHATKLLAIANLPNPDELKTGVHAGFEANIDELAKAGRAVRNGSPAHDSHLSENAGFSETRVLCLISPGAWAIHLSTALPHAPHSPSEGGSETRFLGRPAGANPTVARCSASIWPNRNRNRQRRAIF